MSTWPWLTASVASERVLKKRAAHSHLSIRVDSMVTVLYGPMLPSNLIKQFRAIASGTRLVGGLLNWPLALVEYTQGTIKIIVNHCSAYPADMGNPAR